ncbi:MAG TPA: lipid-A-disaccharide synthase [Acidiferrobacterales bacterium]|nr:lipid-A-disaccharide synthase [Acidiferrobacterales bacterium]
MQSLPPVRIAVVAGEVSGDALGAGLLKALKERIPDIQCEGIGGPEMIAQGCRSLFPMERLSVLGITEVFGRYFEISGIRRRLLKHFLSDPPDLFIGIDSSGFNLGLEQKLKRAGIPTVHYVSPQVWAWRGWRIRKIRQAVDHILVLFPFEEKYYRAKQVPVTFVGHPLADQIPDEPDRDAFRRKLKLRLDATIIALLPGSRTSELKAHAGLFVRTALWLYARNKQLSFIAPFVNRQTRVIFEDAIKKNDAWDLPMTRMFGHSHDAMAASDIVLLASGTAALEAALLKRLMVVTYKVSFFSHLLIKMFSQVKLYSMPNHLAGQELVPELLQRNAVPQKLGKTIEYYLSNPARAELIRNEYQKIHDQLRCNADERAAEAVVALLQKTARVKKTRKTG